jgi:hypothetical protein
MLTQCWLPPQQTETRGRVSDCDECPGSVELSIESEWMDGSDFRTSDSPVGSSGRPRINRIKALLIIYIKVNSWYLTALILHIKKWRTASSQNAEFDVGGSTNNNCWLVRQLGSCTLHRFAVHICTYIQCVKKAAWQSAAWKTRRATAKASLTTASIGKENRFTYCYLAPTM